MNPTLRYEAQHSIPPKSQNTSAQRRRRVSTAHIRASNAFSTAQANFDYDLLVSDCANFLNTSIVNDAAKRLADNILAIMGSPTAMDADEVKRRIEQMLPTDKTLKYHRGMSLSDQDCMHLCNLAGRILGSPASTTNVTIVDESDSDSDKHKDTYYSRVADDVEYIRHNNKEGREFTLPKQLPSFIEANNRIEGKDTTQYDMDVTPYDSEEDDALVLMVP
ncbi:hypothetical protein BDF20DRAFT_868986 [Mycotypha africana]|uniref:uncharacterized protein n=1 Tax=Mycotypha africana TaxID=64632 RepID=UPI00230100A4|nr:uncharacterized protein BDF20DRAFT_868986 [Mycotypha africana]KAI8979340.1 hypothetical protein BDF20DRAFT_868986 [Mycotypha africana]